MCCGKSGGQLCTCAAVRAEVSSVRGRLIFQAVLILKECLTMECLTMECLTMAECQLLSFKSTMVVTHHYAYALSGSKHYCFAVK